MKFPFTILSVLLLGLLPATVRSWGTLGHRTTAYLASLHFSPAARNLVNDLLNDQEITEAALFPDKIRYIPAFHYTAAWHYIDAQDNPPKQCGINITRDCIDSNGGCVVSAIANHTQRVMNVSLPHWERGQSMRFVLHFFGDVHQPLHTENMSRGGNEIQVIFDRRHTNLHSVWDTLIPNKHAATSSDNETVSARVWAEKLYNSQHSFEDECLHDASECALTWAGEANGWVCKYVLKDDVQGLEGRDLGEEYYKGAIPIIDDMVQKGGQRLAAWLNKMAGELEQRESLYEQSVHDNEL